MISRHVIPRITVLCSFREGEFWRRSSVKLGCKTRYLFSSLGVTAIHLYSPWLRGNGLLPQERSSNVGEFLLEIHGTGGFLV